ncbi:sag-related sequence srs11 [Cystoisospora suis]|uniref:Sag-related sequence srs11 n=1 Tax=Cystoisospora suis TaxID=483139 RepID=A0A2C6KJ88_9APIC|nr:sag-related sequence srs11 [Cystoisospora suis]
MRIHRLDCRVTAVSLVLVCVSASGFSIIRFGSADPGDQSSGPTPEVKICKDAELVLTETGQAGQEFKFSCLAGSKLSPVEDTGEPRNKPDDNALKKVNEFGLAKAGQPCNPKGQTLDVLVPGSTLQVTDNNAKRQVVNEQASNLSYTLTLGDGPNEEKHLCYICKAPVAGVDPGKNRTLPQHDCTIYATVSAKPKPETPQQPDSKPDQQTGQDPESQTDPKPDNPSGSGSSSLSVFSWLMLCVSGSVLELMVHL